MGLIAYVCAIRVLVQLSKCISSYRYWYVLVQSCTTYVHDMITYCSDNTGVGEVRQIKATVDTVLEGWRYGLKMCAKNKSISTYTTYLADWELVRYRTERPSIELAALHGIAFQRAAKKQPLSKCFRVIWPVGEWAH